MLPLLVLLITSPPLVPDQPGLPQPFSRQEKLEFYTLVMSVSIEASEQCPGIFTDRAMADKVKEFIDPTTDEMPTVKSLLEAKMTVLAKQAAQDRAAWCEALYKAYGPHGTIMQNFLTR